MAHDNNISGISLPQLCMHHSHGWFNCLCMSKFQFGFIPMGNISAFPHGNAAVQKHSSSYIELYHSLRDSTLPNCMGARLRVPSNMNISAWEDYLRTFYDTQLIDFLKFGFPLDMVPNPILDNKFVRNHPTTTQHPVDIQTYIDKETQHQAILGPFQNIPIAGLHCSPMLTRPKPGAASRRVIVDLSWPKLASVNHNIATDVYMGVPFKLKFPTVDDIVDRIVLLNGKCLLYKVDIRRAFRILKLDPHDIIHTGLQWQGKYFVDTSVPFGYRHGSVCCQRITDAVRYIMHTKGVQHLFNYIDDFIGVDGPAVVHAHFKTLLSLLARLGIPISEDKLFPPKVRKYLALAYLSTLLGVLSVFPQKS